MDVLAAIALFGWLGLFCWAVWSAVAWLADRAGAPLGETVFWIVVLGWLFKH